MNIKIIEEEYWKKVNEIKNDIDFPGEDGTHFEFGMHTVRKGEIEDEMFTIVDFENIRKFYSQKIKEMLEKVKVERCVPKQGDEFTGPSAIECAGCDGWNACVDEVNNKISEIINP